jgi:hypothetical protein
MVLFGPKNLPQGVELKNIFGGRRIISISCMVWEILKFLSEEILQCGFKLKFENLISPRLS